jgi:hypothetical protein
VTGRKLASIDGGKKDDEPEPCQFCGGIPAHLGVSCPRIKEAELYENGALAFVKFFPPDVWMPK